MKYHYSISGMHCAACIDKIKTALSPRYTITQLTLQPPLLEIESQSKPSLQDLNDLIKTAGNYYLAEDADASAKTTGLTNYYPIFLITAYIMLVASLANYSNEGMNWSGWMHHFMAGFFLVFSGFKLLDIKGFAEGYATYDLLAKRWFGYGYVYPFLELGLGILYLGMWFPIYTNVATIIIMGFSSLGVINSLIKKQNFQCACLGTLLKVPLSSITLIEDLTMVLMALLSLLKG